jgi:hypothetical protein
MLAEVAGGRFDTVTRLHAVWGLGQLARTGNVEAKGELQRRLSDADMEVRVQATKTCGELTDFDGRLLVPLLADEAPRVAFQAAIGLGKHSVDDALAPIIKMIEAYPLGDAMMRHAGVMALAGAVPAMALTGLQDHPSEKVRICAVVALRRQGAEGVKVFLVDRNSWIRMEAARAIYDDFSIPAALPDLAAELANTTTQNEAFIRRAIGANFRLGSTNNAVGLANYATRADAPLAMRLEALQALADWRRSTPLDRVTGRYRQAGDAGQVLDVSRLELPLDKILLRTSSELQAASLVATRSLKISIADEVLAKLLQSDAADSIRIEALNSLAAQRSKLLPTAINRAISTGDVALRIRGIELLVKTKKSASLARLVAAWEGARSTRERQRFVSLLAQVGSTKADQKLLEIFAKLQDDVTRPETLEMLEAMKTRAAHHEPIKTAIRAYNDKRLRATESDPLALYRECLEGGNAKQGKSVLIRTCRPNAPVVIVLAKRAARLGQIWRMWDCGVIGSICCGRLCCRVSTSTRSTDRNC